MLANFFENYSSLFIPLIVSMFNIIGPCWEVDTARNQTPFLGDRIRSLSNDGGGGELHPHRGHRGRGWKQYSAHKQPRFSHSGQGIF